MTAESEPFVIHSTSNVYPPLPTSNGEKKDLKPYEVTFTPPNDHNKGMSMLVIRSIDNNDSKFTSDLLACGLKLT